MTSGGANLPGEQCSEHPDNPEQGQERGQELGELRHASIHFDLALQVAEMVSEQQHPEVQKLEYHAYSKESHLLSGPNRTQP